MKVLKSIIDYIYPKPENVKVKKTYQEKELENKINLMRWGLSSS